MTQQPLANSMLVVMVRGLFSKVQFPYAQFPCTKLRGYELYDLFWDAVERLERCGFYVLACTCDGLSVNRRFFKLHGSGVGVFKVANPYSSEKRYMFFISDPPHLIKTVRNSWASNKRTMWVSLEECLSACVYINYSSMTASTSYGLTWWTCTSRAMPMTLLQD